MPVGDTLTWRPVRRTLGVEAFGVNAYTAANAGDEIVEEHDETGAGAGRHEELYVVLAGHVRVHGRRRGDRRARPGRWCSSATRPSAAARTPSSLGRPSSRSAGGSGEPYEVSPWEHYFAAIPAAKAGDWDGRSRSVRGAPEHADNPAVLYNLACFEAQAGRRDDALAHIRRALELDPETTREWAEDDEDLASLRGDFPWD